TGGVDIVSFLVVITVVVGVVVDLLVVIADAVDVVVDHAVGVVVDGVLQDCLLIIKIINRTLDNISDKLAHGLIRETCNNLDHAVSLLVDLSGDVNVAHYVTFL